MALPTKRIFLRSPYFVSKERATLELIIIDLFIYTGTLTTDKPSTAQYRLTSSAHTNDSGNKFAEIDISEFARDYVSVNYDFSSSEPTNAVWIEYDLYYADAASVALVLDSSVKLTGLNGFGYFEDGYNPSPADTVLMTSDYVIVPKKSDAVIPILQDFGNGWELYAGTSAVPGKLLESFSATATAEETANVIDYVSTDATNPNHVANLIRLKFTGGRDDVDIKIIYLEECIQSATRCAFVNRFGAIETTYFFGRVSKSTTTNQTLYKRNVLDGAGSYDTKVHQVSVLNKNSKMSFTADTGWYPENSNGVWQELLNSEKVWMRFNKDFLIFGNTKAALTYPVIIKTQSLPFKTRRHDKLISYVFQMDMAADRINNVR